MEKSKLQSFINRYYLAGNCEAVTLKEQEDSISCELIDMDQTVVGKIKWNTAPFMKGQLGINHTGALIKMLGAVNENIEIEVQNAAGKNYAMKISEGTTKATLLANSSKQKMHCQMQKTLQFKLLMDKSNSLSIIQP